MPGNQRAATRYLYVVRHGEALPDDSGLTERGRRQATLLGRRLRDVPVATVHHSPLPRAVQTAHLLKQQLAADVPLEVSEAAGDYLPYVPDEHELPPDSADDLLRFLQQSTPEDRRPELASAALTSFTGPVDGENEQHDLLVTHNFLIAWLVTRALDAPPWRWLSLSHCNAALTVLRYTPGRPSSVLLYNDMQHLPVDLRWTGFAAGPRV
jgi:probable phosphoglycerate mutase